MTPRISQRAAAALGVSGEPESFLASLPERALRDAAPALGERLPAAFVIGRKDVNDLIVATYHSLFMFVLAVAGLALVAGAVLIANAVSLAMVERRRAREARMDMEFGPVRHWHCSPLQ